MLIPADGRSFCGYSPPPFPGACFLFFDYLVEKAGGETEPEAEESEEPAPEPASSEADKEDYYSYVPDEESSYVPEEESSSVPDEGSSSVVPDKEYSFISHGCVADSKADRIMERMPLADWEEENMTGEVPLDYL